MHLQLGARVHWPVSVFIHFLGLLISDLPAGDIPAGDILKIFQR